MEASKNSRVYEYIERIAETGKVPHALLISGADDEKNKIANLLARVILCTGERKPCGVCNSCHKAENNIHPDLIMYHSERAIIPVGDIRDIRNDSFVFPNDGEKKVYIINEADKMNAEAQNAFLKVLEEPPSFTTFILVCTNSDRLLTTVLSRVTHLKLQSNSDYDEISDELKENARNIAGAISTRDELETLKAFLLCEKRKRDEMASICLYLTAILRDSAVISAIPNDLLANESVSQNILQKLSTNEIIKIMKIIDEARRLAMQNIGISHIVAMCAAKIAESLQ